MLYGAALSAVGLLALAACTADNDALTGGGDAQGKTPIEISAGIYGEQPAMTTRSGEATGSTRSVVTNDKTETENLAQKFAVGTSLYMVMMSEKSGADAVYTRTIGYAQEEATSTSTSVKFASGYNRFWEDGQAADARESKLSVYSVCVPGYYLDGTQAFSSESVTVNGTADNTTPWTIGTSSAYSNTWGNNDSYGATTIAWPLRSASVADQSETNFIACQDLCFSNNLSKHSDINNSDNLDERLKYENGKFTSGRMVFYHALTKVTFKIKKGDGFETTDNFAFTNSATENIVLKGFNTGGSFDFKTGEYSSIETNDITKMATKATNTTDGYAYVLTCLMLPGSDLNGADNDDLDKVYFTIDNNKYHIKKSQLLAALKDNSNNTIVTDKGFSALDGTTMRPGVEYIFELTVGKKKMDNITASVVPWETATAETVTPSNARITLQLLKDGTLVDDDDLDIALYRKANELPTTQDINDNAEFVGETWNTGYTFANNKANLVESTTNGQYTAKDATDTNKDWFWPNNRTFYHFRTVMPKSQPVTADNGGDYITLAGAQNYTDVCWGAPFKQIDKSTEKLTYDPDKHGFDGKDNDAHQIYKAIGPTEDAIDIELFHMMSDVKINLTTTTGDDKVDLEDAQIKLSKIYPTATVKMGNGLVTPTGTATDVTGTVENSGHSWHYGFVPQPLNDVVLTITTKDHNQYVINMNEIVVAEDKVSNNLIANPYTKITDEGTNKGKYTIDHWYPNYQYTYTFTLKKSKVAAITATLADWENVTAGNDNVKIK